MRGLFKLLFIIALVVGGILGYRALIPPDIEIVSVRVVDAVTALEDVGRSSGQYVFTGGNKLILTRDNPEGSHLLIRARVGQKLIREAGHAGQVQDIRFSAMNARLWRGGSKTEPDFLTDSVKGPMRVDVSYAKRITAADWGNRLARIIEGLKKAGETEVKGATRFGEGVGTKGTGDVLHGNTDVTCGKFKISYTFGEGSATTVKWNDEADGWYAMNTISGPNTMTDFMNTWTVDMLFPRPGTKGAGEYELKIFDQATAKVDPAKQAPKKE